MKNDDLLDLLYGRIVEGVGIPGLIKESERGTLFLDEFDKVVDRGFYSELLRVLEAGEYVPKGGANIEHVNDVNWIFAGAFTGSGSSKNMSDLPPDFWSRLTAKISINNPLKLEPVPAPDGHACEKISYAGAIFAYFLLREAVSFAGGVSALFASKPKFPADYAQKLLFDLPSGNKEFQVSNRFEKLMNVFQTKITNGVYWRLDEQPSDSKEPAVIAKRWTDEKNVDGDDVVTDVSENKYQPHKAYDSVRSIIKASQAAFVFMRDKSMTSVDFWQKASTGSKPPQDHLIDAILDSAAKRAARIVKDARPGKILTSKQLKES